MTRDELFGKLRQYEMELMRMVEEETMDSAEKRLNELGYKQELRREMVFFILFFLYIFAILCLMELILDPSFL